MVHGQPGKSTIKNLGKVLKDNWHMANNSILFIEYCILNILHV